MNTRLVTLVPVFLCRCLLSTLAIAALTVAAQSVDDANNRGQVIENIYVYGEPGETDTATKLNLTLFETPQTVSAISRLQLDDFALTDVNSVMDYSPGVTVEDVETNRTYYTARGFDIVNFQYDGVGTPFTFGLNKGDQDTAIYEQVEVVKGAAGLITGLANPSATINYKRKRPTDDLLFSSTVSANDWNGYRVEADLAGAMTQTLRARLVVAKEDTESYLDRYEEDNALVYGVVEVDLSPSTLLTLGHSYNKNDSIGGLWGALPLVYSDGRATDYDVSTNTAADWTFFDITRRQTVVELQQQLGGAWTLNAIYTNNTAEFASELFYVYGTPDPVTELGLSGYASGYRGDEDQAIADVYVSGLLSFGGRQHELVIGYNRADIDSVEGSYYDSINGFPTLGPDWAAGHSPQPNLIEHDPFNDASDIEQKQESFYFSSRLHLTDRLSVLLGAREAEVTQTGFSYGGASNTAAKETVPYYGATLQLSDNLMLYGSYSEVFVQQTWVNDLFQPLGPTRGDNAEIGVKQAFNDGQAILTVALFQAEHTNLGEFVGRDPGTGTAFYAARDFDSEGYEVEISGELLERMNISAGFTKVDVENSAGVAARPYVPSKLFKLSASYTLPALPAFKVGGVLKWQDDIHNTHAATGAIIEQPAYTLLDLMARYDISANVTAALNIGNITDEKYLNSIYWEQAFYGAPRHVSASVTWRY